MTFALEFGKPEPRLSATQRRTRRNQAMIANGFNPGTRLPLLKGSDKTCGDCGNFWGKRQSGVWFKCLLAKNTNGPGSDIRKSWPACEKFK